MRASIARIGHVVFCEGSPAMASPPPLHECCLPGTVAGSTLWLLISRCGKALASGRARRCHADFAGDGPDEGRQLARDGGCHHRGRLALARQRAEPLAEPDLGFPGDLACRPWCSRDQRLLLVSDARRRSEEHTSEL